MEIERLEKEICFKEFYDKYLVGNEPCLLGKNFIGDWPCFRTWAISVSQEPDWEKMKKLYGECLVPVAVCEKTFYNAQEKTQMTFSDYVDYLLKYKEEGYPKSSSCLYLKDWHFMSDFPNDKIYSVPVYFRSDWLNEFLLRNAKDDYRFVYMGPKGSWTPFHRDVFGSYSWSANIFGKKKWILVPPGDEEKLKSLNDSKLPYDLATFQDSCDSSGIRFMTIIQNAGEVIFVPSGWHHQVWNLEDTISINHNWFNAANILHIRDRLYEARKEVENELSDFRDVMDPAEWKNQVELVLRCHHGMNIEDFHVLLNDIIKSYTSGNPALASMCRACNETQGSLCNTADFAEFNVKKAKEAMK